MTAGYNATWAANQTDVRSDIFLFKNGLKYLSHYTPSEIDNILSTYFKFMFVRHPIDRLVSAYRDKFRTTKPNAYTKDVGRRILLLRKNRASLNDVTSGLGVQFSEFAHYLATTKDPMYEHWTSYEELCEPCFVQYDFIGKMETMKEDLDYVLSRIWPDESDKWFPHPPWANHSPTLTSYFWSLVPSIDKKRIQAKYENDFQLFSYRHSTQKNSSNIV